MKIESLKSLKKKTLLVESKKLMSISIWRRRIIFWGGGISVGLVCVLFAYLCDHVNNWFLRFSGNYPYWPLVITPVGFMLIVYVMRYMFDGSEGSGIPQVMTALQVKNSKRRSRLVSIRIALGKFGLTIVGFMCGASIGREGPTIQLSASVMNFFGKLDKFKRDDVERGLLLAGGAAGIAAAFNAPLAGIIFAIEELAGSYEKGVSGTIITTVVLSGVVAWAFLGNYTYFGSSGASLNIFQDGWFIILVCAVLGGLLGGLFSWLLVYISGQMLSIVRRHPLWIAGILGLIVALIGLISNGETYGSGYEAAKAVITGDGQSTSVLYGFYKMLATLLTYLSGIPGGIFAPSLSAGAGFGSMVAHFFSPEFEGAIVLLVMVAYFSGVVQSPITAFIIVSEMTNTATSNMILPIMISSIIATTVSRAICREPLYHSLAKRYLDKVKASKQKDKIKS
ncbi:chloride channel protein [Thiotrichales bacterium 19S3-7]|nr:chloride channel protein [Thiotrichales bacterium 19S3-7]MCF6801895.1 chloride channel protein [Thiotrichales bacterium 19S3-11]